MTHEGATPSHECGGGGTDMVRIIGVGGKSAQQQTTVTCTDAARVAGMPLTVPRPFLVQMKVGGGVGPIITSSREHSPLGGNSWQHYLAP